MPTPSDTPTSTPSNLMSVSAVEMWYKLYGNKFEINIKVTVVAEGQPLQGATVSISIEKPNGNLFTALGTIGSDGTITFIGKTKKTGTYTSQVTNVTHANYTWDGIQVSQTLPIP